MFAFLWVPVTVAAAASQVCRNALQRGLLTTSGPWAATLVRFMFGIPFAAAMVGVAFAATPGAVWHLGPRFWAAALSGALAQILATACLLVAMRRAGFAVGTALQQSSLPFAAVMGLLLGDRLTAGGWAGVGLTTLGLVVLTWPREATGPQPVTGGLFGILGGLCFAYCLNAFRIAGLSLDPGHPVFSALATVLICQIAQTTGLSAVLFVADRRALRSVLGAWRRSVGAGLFGALSSAGWFVATALAPAAQVRAVGVVEAPIAALAARRLFKERLHPKQILAGLAVLVGVAMTAFGKG